MTTPIASIDNATLLNLTPNLDVGDIADPALRLAYFQYLNVYIQTITTAFNAFVANGAVGTVNLADLSVTTGKLALLAVTAAQIANGTITSTQLALLAVANANVAAGIDAVKLADGSVTNTELQFINSLTSNAQNQLDAKIPLTQKGAASGVASLDSGAKVPIAQLPDAIVGALQYQGTWNASTNTPTLSASPTTIKGYFYIVSVAGTQFSISFDVGDWIVSNGTIWQKVDNTDAVSTVFGRTGAIVAATNDYTWAQIDKSVSSLLDLAIRSASDLNTGTLPVGRVPTGIPATSIGNGDVPNAILSFLNTLSSNAQTQLDTKAPITSPTFLTSAVLPSNTTIGSVSATEISYLDNATSSIQSQLDAKASLTHVGAGGSSQHPDATTSQSGFISAADLIAFRSLTPTGLGSYAVPVGQIFSLWSRYSQEQDPVTGEMVFYEI